MNNLLTVSRIAFGLIVVSLAGFAIHPQSAAAFPPPCTIDLQQVAKMNASDAATDDQLGYSISSTGDTVIVGAPYDDFDSLSGRGSAYVFRWNGTGWQQVAKLTASDSQAGDDFGFSVSISGDTAVIGAPDDDDAGNSSGSAYVFREIGGVWQQIAKLTASDASSSDSFGNSVGICGNHIIIGAYRDSAVGSSSGSAYIFREVGGVWQQKAKLFANDTMASDAFGYSVAIDGNVAVIGVVSGDGAAEASGSAYVFSDVNGIWQKVVKLVATDGQSGDAFGCSVAIDQDTIIVGALDDDLGGASTGSAHIFQKSNGTWQPSAKLTIPAGSRGLRFGTSVAIRDGVAVVGAYQGSSFGDFGGSAYLFRASSAAWQLIDRLDAIDNANNDQFGWSVALASGFAVVAAKQDDDVAADSGSAYAFDISAVTTDCNQNDIPDVCDIIAGSDTDADTNGIPDGCDQAAYDCDTDGIPNESELLDNDCNTDGFPDNCELVTSDCNTNGVPDECDLSSGLATDCGTNGVPDTCESDCDTNGIPDDCDDDCNSNGISDACESAAFDCNTNSVPDSCEFAADCNTNGISDHCDSIAGDCNTNGIPDECDLDSREAVVWADTTLNRIVRQKLNGGTPFYYTPVLSGPSGLAAHRARREIYLTNITANTIQRINYSGAGLTTILSGLSTPRDIAVDEIRGYIYWTQPAAGEIRRARLDGTDMSIVLAGLPLPFGIDVDSIAGKIYWTNQSDDTIRRANLDGTEMQTIHTITGGATPMGIAVDTNAGKVYWSDRFRDEIMRVNIDGTNVETVVDTGLSEPAMLALDLNAGHLYWTDFGNQTIRRINLDGTQLMGIGLSHQAPRGIDVFPRVTSFDCNTNDVPDECEPELDCNTNGLMDWCEENFPDCDLNGIPDACELEGFDCNTNGVLDDCDLIALAPDLDELLMADDASANGFFGNAVSVDGNTMIIGAVGDNGLRGAAYIFREFDGQWQQVAKVVAADADALDRFGYRVALDGDTALIGAYGDDEIADGSGAAYVFREIGGVWLQVAKLTASDGAVDDQFGLRVAISGGTAMIGANRDDELFNNSGSAYIFRDVGGVWQQIAKLTANDPGTDASFGESVLVRGDVAFAGAPLSHGSATFGGAVYVFEELAGTWQQTATIHSDTPENGEFFGASVAFDGTTLAIGAYGADAVRGATYFFRRIAGAWQQVARIQASDAVEDLVFGLRVSIDGDTAIIGARYHTIGYQESSAYIFREIGGIWRQVAKMTSPSAPAITTFGLDFARRDDKLFLGAYSDGESPVGTGSVYVYSMTLYSDDTNDNGLPDECESIGCTTCPGDINGDNAIDGDDVQCYVECLLTGTSANCSNCECATISVGDFVASILAAPDGCP